MQKNLSAELTQAQPPSRFRRAIAWLTLIAYLGQPLAVTAQVVADANAAANKRPVIDTAANGIPLVQIAAPNASGLSHNQYSLYNVDPNGVILNNSSTATLTQQAGYVGGNQSMANGSARIILNEVTGTAASQLNGHTEVAGSRAEVIIANPNGIFCNGCGFINTSRGVLTTGTPVFGGSGSLDAFRVTGGQISIDAGGLNASNTGQLDLIARSVKVNDNLWANNLNIVTGVNQINYDNLGVQIIAGDANKPTVGIDVAQLGGMYANKIHLVGTEAGVGVNSLGNIAAQAGDFNLDSQGQISLAGSTSASGNIIINGAAGTTNSGILYSQQNLQITDQGTINNSGVLSAQGNLSLDGANINSSGTLGAGIAANGTATQSGTLMLTSNAGAIANSGRVDGSMVAATSKTFANTGTVIGNDIFLNTATLTNANGTAIIAGTKSVNLTIQNELLNQDGATIYSLGDVNIGSNLALDANGYLVGNTGRVNNSSAIIEANDNLRIGASTLINQRTVVGVQYGPEVLGAYVTGNPRYTPSYANQQFTPTTTVAGQLLSGGNMWLGGGMVTNDYSKISAGNALTSNATVTNSGASFLQRMTVTNGLQDMQVLIITGYSCKLFSLFGGCVGGSTPDYGYVTSTIAYAPAPTYTQISGSDNVIYLANTPTMVAPPAISTQSLPSNGLFTIHTQPGQQYLVVTDSRFTSYQNFISSDYMLSRLALDPGMIQLRLGDGFYEQQWVTDQVTQLTGRRFLGQYASAEEQFKALMDSGIASAKEFNLIPGVALTAAQMAALTSDIVWMVEETVKLPEGGTTTVLAPRIYLCQLHDGDLQPSGALMAAASIDLKTNGTLANSGTIRSAANMALEAEDILNQGGTINSGGSLGLRASNDIVNLSGQIAAESLNLVAGRDIVNSRNTKEITRTAAVTPASKFGLMNMTGVTGNSSSTELGLEAGITATEGMILTAGRDISIVAATVKVGNNANLNAGQNIVIDALNTQQSDSGAYSAYHNTVTNLTSQLDIGGDLSMVAGNDLQMTAAQVNAGNNMSLVAGGNIDMNVAKDSDVSGYYSGVARQRRLDETVVGTSINAGNNLILIASSGQSGRIDGNGNITFESAQLQSKGTTIIAADNNIDIQAADETHTLETQTRTESHGITTTHVTTTRDYVAHTDAIGSNIGGGSVVLQAGNDLTITGSQVVAENDATLAAGNNVVISAATNTRSEDHYRHETTTGLQFTKGGITDIGPDITSQAYLDTTKQSDSQSVIQSNNGNINVIAANSLIVIGSQLQANAENQTKQENIDIAQLATSVPEGDGSPASNSQGQINLGAGNTIAIYAGQDTYKTDSSVIKVTNDNPLSKQKLTITDSTNNLSYFGSNLNGNSISLQSGGDTVLQAASLASGQGGTRIDAGGDLQLLAALGVHSTTHSEKLQTEGVIDVTAVRRMDKKAESQDTTAQLTQLVSAGDIQTHSGGDTILEATVLDAAGGIALSATGYDATYNEDGTTNAGRDGKILFKGVKEASYYSVTDTHNSSAWQSSSGGGQNVETLKLATIKAGEGLTVDATGGVEIDLPAATTDASAAPSSDAKGLRIFPAVLTPEQQAEKNKTDLDRELATLASQPGQEWLGQLARQDNVKFNQVKLAAEHWNYAHDGLTPEGAAIVVVVVAYFTAGAASGAAGTMTGAAAGTTTVASAALAAGMTTLASQAAVSLINNKGDIGKTLNDMGKSENVRNVIAAMVTAGMGADYLKTYNAESFAAKTLAGCATGDMTGSGCEKGATTAAFLAGSDWINHAMRADMIEDSKKFKGITDSNDPYGKIYNNATGQGSVGVNGDTQRIAGTRVDIGALREYGTITPPTTDNPLWTFSGKINPDTGKAFTLTDALNAQTGLTGGSQALAPTFANRSVAPGGSVDRLEESFAGPHDYFGGVVWNGYDDLGNANVNQPSWFRNGMAIIDIPLVTPLVIPTFLQQVNLDPVALSNTIHNGTH